METNNTWHGISICGVSPHYLNSAFGFEPVQPATIGQRFTVGLDVRCDAPSDRYLLSNAFITAELHSGRAAHLTIHKTATRAEADQYRLPLNAALTQQWLLIGQLAVHGALIRLDGRGILVLGESQAGKSTLVQAAMQLGLQIVTDDFLRVSFANAYPTGHCLRGFLRFRASAKEKERIVVLQASEPLFCPLHRIDAIIFLEGGERPSQSRFSRITRLQAMTLMINQCAPLFLRREFPLERQIMLDRIGVLIDRLPRLSVATGFDLLEQPRHFMQRLIATMWAD